MKLAALVFLCAGLVGPERTYLPSFGRNESDRRGAV